jgi:hypothetical protein
MNRTSSLVAALALAAAGTVFAQGNPPTTASPNPATAAGQQSPAGGPMGTTGHHAAEQHRNGHGNAGPEFGQHEHGQQQRHQCHGVVRQPAHATGARRPQLTLAQRAEPVSTAFSRYGALAALLLACAPAQAASEDALQFARAAVAAGDNKAGAFAVVDKKLAKVFVFDANGALRGASPVLLGLAHGDASVPGIGERKMSEIRPEERTTPAGRFASEPGRNLSGEDIVWARVRPAADPSGIVIGIWIASAAALPTRPEPGWSCSASTGRAGTPACGRRRRAPPPPPRRRAAPARRTGSRASSPSWRRRRTSRRPRRRRCPAARHQPRHRAGCNQRRHQLAQRSAFHAIGHQHRDLAGADAAVAGARHQRQRRRFPPPARGVLQRLGHRRGQFHAQVLRDRCAPGRATRSTAGHHALAHGRHRHLGKLEAEGIADVRLLHRRSGSRRTAAACV